MCALKYWCAHNMVWINELYDRWASLVVCEVNVGKDNEGRALGLRQGHREGTLCNMRLLG